VSGDSAYPIRLLRAVGCRSSLSLVVNDLGGKSTNDRRTKNQGAGASGSLKSTDDGYIIFKFISLLLCPVKPDSFCKSTLGL
jgi:hypothetical protein